MPSRPYEAHPKKENRPKHPRSTNNNTRKHGNLHGPAHAASGTYDVLLSIPSESLTHVTAYLDPPDLLALARTCKPLHAHVTDDNTWRRAYVHQYLGISPESDLHDEAGDKTLMLRREESSWRKEFILRYNLRRYVMSICASEWRVVHARRAFPGVVICALLSHAAATRSAIRAMRPIFSRPDRSLARDDGGARYLGAYKRRRPVYR